VKTGERKERSPERGAFGFPPFEDPEGWGTHIWVSSEGGVPGKDTKENNERLTRMTRNIPG
jgi:hypothetical protein